MLYPLSRVGAILKCVSTVTFSSSGLDMLLQLSHLSALLQQSRGRRLRLVGDHLPRQQADARFC